MPGSLASRVTPSTPGWLGWPDVYQHGIVGDNSIKKNHKIYHILVSHGVLRAVQRTGFLPWGSVMASDHRTGFLNIDVKTLFGEIDDPTHASNRLLHTKYFKRTKKYKEEVQAGFEAWKLCSSMAKLTKKAKRREVWTKKMQETYENIDRESTQIMLKAEENCVKNFRFQTPWSIPLMQTSKKIKYWNLKLSKHNGRKVSEAALQEAKQSANIADFTTEIEHVIVKGNLARIQLKDQIRNAEYIREKELREREQKKRQRRAAQRQPCHMKL